MSGSGLQPPPNAPPGGPLVPGIQPGVQQAIILAQIVIVFGTAGGVFVYSGTPGPGNPPIAWMTAATADPYGNAVTPQIGTRDNVTGGGIHLSGSAMILTGPGATTNGFISTQRNGTGPSSTTQLNLSGPSDSSNVPQLLLIGESADTTQPAKGILQGFNLGTSAPQPMPWQLSGSLAATSGTADTVPTLAVTGNTSGAGEAALVKQSNTAGDHALTVLLSTGGSGGAAQAALNVVSDNNNFSTAEVTGAELNRGTVKITHKGQTAGTDASAAAVSVDLQTAGGTGTAAQGIFITSTTDAIPGGNAFTVRYNSQDYFVIKGGNSGAGQGTVGIGIATGHIPAGMLEIAQKDTAVPGLFMEAIAAGADLVQLKDSGGTLRFQVNNAGNLVARANTFHTGNVIVGSTSAGTGGAGSAIQVAHTADPTTNPPAGSVLLYTDATGHLIARGSAGTLTTLAGP